MDYRTIRAILNRIGRLSGQIRKLADALAAVNAKTQRTGTTVGPLSILTPTDVTITWPNPWPDTSYAVLVGIVTGTAAIGNAHATLKAGSKTTTECVITIAVLANIASVGVDVVGIRT